MQISHYSIPKENNPVVNLHADRGLVAASARHSRFVLLSARSDTKSVGTLKRDKLRAPGHVSCLRVVASSGLVVTGSSNGEVSLWDIQASGFSARVSAHDDAVTCLQVRQKPLQLDLFFSFRLVLAQYCAKYLHVFEALHALTVLDKFIGPQYAYSALRLYPTAMCSCKARRTRLQFLSVGEKMGRHVYGMAGWPGCLQ